MQNNPKLFTRKQVADYFNVNIRTIDRWIKIGTIRPDEVISPNGQIRIKESAIERIVRGE